MPGFEEGGGDAEKDVDCGGPAFGFDVACGDDTGLLLRFVELAFSDSGGVSVGVLCLVEECREGGDDRTLTAGAQ